jgi:mRNA interferase MazF
VNVKRYEIYLADLNPTLGSEINKVRPVVVVSQNEMNKYLDTVVVCPLTSRLHPQWRTRIQIQCAGNASEIAVDQIRTISKQRLKQKLDQLHEDKAAQLRKVITDMYGSEGFSFYRYLHCGITHALQCIVVCIHPYRSAFICFSIKSSV